MLQYYDLGHATNNTAKMVKTVLDPRDEDVVRMNGHVRRLNYPPACIIVRVDNVQPYHVDPTLPAGCIPLFPSQIKERISLGDGALRKKRKPTECTADTKEKSFIRINRHAYSFSHTIANSDFLVQGKTHGSSKLVLDLR